MSDRRIYQFEGTASAAGPIPPQQRMPGWHGAPDSPIRADFPDGPQGAADYVTAWRAWLQMCDDGRLTAREADVRATVLAEHFGVPAGLARMQSLDRLRWWASRDADERERLIQAFEIIELMHQLSE